MIFEDIKLFSEENTYFKAYVCDPMPEFGKRRAVLVIPGGGYSMVCDSREGDAVARAFLAKGFNTYVLKYSVKPYATEMRPMIQAAKAIKYIRENAERHGTDPEKIFTCGFSAGGHLACSAGVFWNHPRVREALGDAPEGINRPDGMILCYPVITAGDKAHKGSIYNLCGSENATQEEMDAFSLEKQVDATTPPAFLWHTFADDCVPVENSLYFAFALRENNIPFEMHIYPEGWHGMALATPETSQSRDGELFRHIRTWFDLACDWTETVK